MKDIPSQRVVWTLRVLSVVALSISAYLAWVAFNSTGVAGCGGNVFDCDHVLSSRWSRWFQVPVGAAAAALYFCSLWALGFCRTNSSYRKRQLAWRAFTICGLAAGLAAVWFIALQFFVLGHLCSYCLVAHTCGLAIAGTILWTRPLGGRSTAAMSLVSVAGVLVLIGGQFLTPEKPKWEAEYFVVESSGQSGETDHSDVTTDSPVFEAPDFESEDVFEPPSLDDDSEPDGTAAQLENQK
jgi:uncharacterized membrane protein